MIRTISRVQLEIVIELYYGSKKLSTIYSFYGLFCFYNIIVGVFGYFCKNNYNIRIKIVVFTIFHS